MCDAIDGRAPMGMSDEPDDSELLRRWAAQRDEAAFGELVRRHLDLVYGCALRRLAGDAHLAKDVTQLVFCDLARRAGGLVGRAVLGGWLHTSTRFAAAKAVRGEQRRRAREGIAFAMKANDDAAVEWERLRPVLDEAIDALGELDREAVVLRFFEGRSFAEIGARLHLTENTARMRVERALEKLHTRLERRGIGSTAVALGVALAGNAAMAAPAGLAGAVTTGALAGGTTASAALTWLGLMGAKLQIGVAAAIAAVGGAGYWWQMQDNAEVRRQIAALQAATPAMAKLEDERARQAALTAEVADLRRDDAELARLRDDVARLQQQRVARSEAAKAAKAGTALSNSGATVYSLGQVDRQPVPKRQPVPAYPQALRNSGERHEAMVEFAIDTEGNVLDAKALRATHPDIATAAVEGVSRWQFQPGEKDGAKVTVRIQMPIVFTMNKEVAKVEPWF